MDPLTKAEREDLLRQSFILIPAKLARDAL
jgi:hypothetical protein